jgi:predicted phage baseplate assembly protein
MPLADLLPVIDDRRFADLVAEARTRIPRYTPEWTDLNENDPGIALLELFAWMTELLTFRLGKVPQLNYVKFLQLVGFELSPAEPATAEITLPVQPSFDEPYVIVPQATQVATEKPDDKGPIIFELDRALIALTAKLDAVLISEPPTFRDVTAANDRKQGFDPFGPRAAVDAALMLGFRSDTLGFPSVEIDIACFIGDTRKPWDDPRYIQGGQPPARPDGDIAWEYWSGIAWRSLDVVEDETAALTRSGHVRLGAPPEGGPQRAFFGPKTDAQRFWMRGRLTRSGYQVPPRLLAVRSSTMSATQAETIALEVLGGSNGQPDQVVKTSAAPVLAGSLVLEVDEGQGYQTWSEVPDFFGAGRDDAVYVLDRATGEVRFGDGTNGRIPLANAQNRANIRARVYRAGGGRRGNIEAGALKSLMSGVTGIDSDKVQNLLAAAGGTDEEGLAVLQKRAAASLKSHDRAVTPEDYEELALRAANVRRARALPLFHPAFRGVEVPGVVSVVIVPDVPRPAPTPTEGTLRAVLDYLDQRRLLTTELYAVAPKYRTITVTAALVVADDADLAAVRRDALASITRYFDPLVGGEDSSLNGDGSGWPFGGGVYNSLVTRRLLVSGVLRVASLELKLDDDIAAPCTDLTIDPDTLLTNGEHSISVSYEGETP